ncbi:unnamed protein product [Heterosigma akashiwo]
MIAQHSNNSSFGMLLLVFLVLCFTGVLSFQNAMFASKLRSGLSTVKYARQSSLSRAFHSSSLQKSKNLLMSAVAKEAAEKVTLPTNEDNENLLKIRHTTAHVMAMAVQKLYPEAQVTIGPWIDNGFYYDFFFPDGSKLGDEDLKAVKKEMDRIIKAKLPLRREEVSREEARARIEALGEPFKLEILDSIKTEPITIYHVGEEWWDLCAGPHVETTGDLPPKAIQLQSVAGAYWRGDESRETLQRIYGTAWEDAAQLKAYKQMLEEAKKRDHRLLGKKLDLFSLQEDAGGGLVFWHPKGSIIRRTIEDYWKQAHLDGGYELLYTPHVANLDLWKTSGHFDFYKEGMFDQMDVEGEAYQIKPMNCPFHCLVYKDALRSYRELPVRWAELGTVYRLEMERHPASGLILRRRFTQDDAHVFCLPDQLEDELVMVCDLIETILSKFGFDDYQVMLSTRPEKSVGGDEIWSLATDALKGALDRKGWSYGVDEGGGAFYGPKIDIKIRDAIGRTWQCSTVQCDFNLPERFDLEYVSSEGDRKRPVMVHRAIFGSLERFFGILVENSAGDFPLWLAPVQMRLLPVTDKVMDFCLQVKAEVARTASGWRWIGADRLAKQIRNAEQQKIPIMAVVGEKEVEERTLSLRARKGGDLGALPLEQVYSLFSEAIASSKELYEGVDVPAAAAAAEEEPVAAN